MSNCSPCSACENETTEENQLPCCDCFNYDLFINKYSNMTKATGIYLNNDNNKWFIDLDDELPFDDYENIKIIVERRIKNNEDYC